MRKAMSKNQKVCDCGSLATRRSCGANVCEFCFWCQTQLVKGGEVKRRAEPLPQPVVKKFPAWHAMVEAVRELHGQSAFWSQRNLPREKFAALFRR
jgi:hypothetical protein